MTNPFEAYRNNPSSPKESQKETDERRRKESLVGQDAAIKKNLETGNTNMARRILEARKRVAGYKF